MRLPYIEPTNDRRKQQTVQFLGINYMDVASEGTFEDTKNISTERFPCLSPRKGRSIEAGYENVTAVYYKDGQFLVDGTNLYYDGEVIAQVTEGKKQFVSINSKVVIYPDKILYDTATGEVRTLGALFVGDAGVVEIVDSKTLALHQGKYATVVAQTGNVGGGGGKEMTLTKNNSVFTVHDSARVDSETGAIVISSGTEQNASAIKVGMVFTKVVKNGEVLLELDSSKQFAVVTKRYYFSNITPSNPEPGGVSVVADDDDRPAKYGFDYEVREASGASYGSYKTIEEMGFREGDTIEIEGMTTFSDLNGTYNLRAIGTLTQDDGSEVQTMVFDADLFPEVGTEAGAVTIRRKTPELTVVCESNNRLWGAEGDTIYASALGDPTNFYTYDGLDTDSYAVAVASEGAFTGCCGFGNSVLFWKEDRLHKILGAYPSQYTMYEYNVPGVKLGSEQSLVNINEVLYYHGRDGVYRYSGGAPDLASEMFGMRRFEEASAGAAEGRYYLSMKDRQSGAWGLWVYDTLKGLWVQEDDTRAMNFANDAGKLYCIGAGKLMCINPDHSSEAIEWSATTARMDEVVHERKYYPKLNIRLDLPAGSRFVVEVSQDDGDFRQIGSMEGTTGKTVILPILLPRCDNFRIRMSGTGPVLVRSLVREYEVGSELF